jgi:uncharacterized protein (TIGR00299 family) protein
MSPPVAYVDPIGGAAGDMLLAALVDAGAPLQAVRSAVDAVLPARFRIDTEEVRRGGLRARLLSIDGSWGGTLRASRGLRELRVALDAANLSPAVAERARTVLDRLGRAEAHVHGVGLDELLLDELGDDDTLLDVVGVAAALEALDVKAVLVGPVALADPGPATLELLRGFVVRGAGSGETVTPTAAAIFAALGAPTDRFPGMAIESIGYGAGTRDPSDVPNVVRVVLGTMAGADGDEARVRDLVVLEANLDDLTPELVADAVQALLAAGALDAWTVPVQMKKGRPGAILSALCEPGREEVLRGVLFETTSTFGVRAHVVRRTELERRVVTVPLAGGTVRLKVAILEGRVVTATPEHDDVAQVAAASGRPIRALYEAAAAAAQEFRTSWSETRP